jgi:cysteine-rich repeat protein
MNIPQGKVADATMCKNDYNKRTNRSLSNGQLLTIAVEEFCAKEKRLAESVNIFSNIQLAEDTMATGWCVCGDGFVCHKEMCDDGNTDYDDGCNSTCTSNEICGNSFVDPGELCDDGNIVAGDGCENTCTPTPTTTTTTIP